MPDEITAPDPAVLAGQELTNAERAADTAREHAAAAGDDKAANADLGVDRSLTPTQVEMAQTAAAEESAPDDRPGLDTSGADDEEAAAERANAELKSTPAEGRQGPDAGAADAKVQALVDQYDHDNLVKLAADEKVEVSKSATKTEIAQAIVDARG